ncbi:MAG: HAMP domain-containing histidine kinase [Clostridiaceae bacterium]|nr:HAMP domain-containing histidine kinase [Clostridiaceae bacterium]
MEIAESKDVDLNKKIPVTSNDEIGDLVMAFNKIQEKQKEYIKKLNDNQEIMMQQDRLASLGQMIGGIAHNMKTPIMSISGGFEALKDLIKEYDESIGEDSVTIEDHHEIAAEMREWIEKMKPYLSYMSDIISAVKGQAVKLNESSQHTFTIRELADRIKILMKYELKRYECSMDVDIQIEPEAELRGEVNNLVQVLNNLISNAIDAYDGKGGKIEFGIYRKGLIIEFIVKDYGKGISNEVKNRLFKEMLTTKGKKGTGLGLYMSYSAIRAKFGGNMWFESEVDKGTTFYVSIPFL